MRFGTVAFADRKHLAQPAARRWTRTSPQHVDREALARLIPPEMFDACFTIVRHPVARLVSVYHFQKEVEKLIPADLGFSDWLGQLEAGGGEDPFRYDNHLRPMTDFVPEGATVFHLEHGVDALIPWLDAVVGDRAGPRAIPHENTRGQYVRAASDRVRPGASEVGRIARLYAEDFRRFGYDPAQDRPLAPAPDLDPAFATALERERRRMRHPVTRLVRKVRRKLG